MIGRKVVQHMVPRKTTSSFWINKYVIQTLFDINKLYNLRTRKGHHIILSQFINKSLPSNNIDEKTKSSKIWFDQSENDICIVFELHRLVIFKKLNCYESTHSLF